MTTVALTAPSLDGWYSKKDATYFDGLRHDFLDRMPQNLDAHILEIGCGTGATGRVALSSGKCQRYVGVELMADAAAVARRDLSQVVVGNIEHLDADFPDAPFDALILSEVLEHLIDPWAALGKLSRVLKPGAKVFASSPNVAHWWIIASLLGGRFDLTDRG
nr:class I SAM-dependent methyltransferase [Alphaproteobacteria bacterium]